MTHPIYSSKSRFRLLSVSAAMSFSLLMFGCKRGDSASASENTNKQEKEPNSEFFKKSGKSGSGKSSGTQGDLAKKSAQEPAGNDTAQMSSVCSSFMADDTESNEPANAHAEYLAGPNDKLWSPGSIIQVGFLDGDIAARKKVAEIASQWTNHGNIHFRFYLEDGAAKKPDVLVTFKGQGYYSYIGTDVSRLASRKQHTMRLGGLDRKLNDRTELNRVILHEFGHTLGFTHEHQSPKTKFQWNKAYIYKHFQRTNGWDKATIDSNVFRRLDETTTRYFATDFDDKSIMLYAFPPEFTTNGFSTKWNTELSPTDKETIGKVYPGKNGSSQVIGAGDEDNIKKPVDPEPPPEVESKPLSLANTSKYSRKEGERSIYDWTIFLTGGDKTLGKIKNVKYVLHPTFNPMVREGNSSKKGFPLSAAGWGTFTIRAFVFFDDGNVKYMKYKLKLGT